MKTFKELLENKYTKKSAVSNSKEISQEIYNLVQNSKGAEQILGRVSKNKMKPDMFKIELYSGGVGEDWNAKPLSYKQGQKTRGRKASKTYEYISIRFPDWFNGDTVRRNFKTAKAFNAFLDTLRKA